jgi:hypothetical protein
MSKPYDGFVDYYVVLGISPQATLAEINRAYRAAAMKCHPDHGGSHEKMKLINEAWIVLSDPDRRREYDEIRTQKADTRTRADWGSKAEDVRRKAEEYPRQWGDFERWMNGFVDDINAATYGTTKVGPVHFPVAGKSVSGWGCIIAGAGVALLIFMTTILGAVASAMHGGAAMIVFLFVAAAGGWVGMKLHKFCRDVFCGGATRVGTASGPAEKDTPPRDARDFQGPKAAAGASQNETRSGDQPYVVLQCTACGQSLRVPAHVGEIVITCPKCRNKFTCKKRS